MQVQSKAIISLTTIPERLSDTHYGDRGLISCILSLCKQTYNNYEIHFNIPYIYSLHNVEYIIPEWLEKLQTEYPQLKIFRTDDMGPSTKILPTIRRIEDPSTVLIIVDDDQQYHEQLVEEHVKNQQILENCAIGYDGLGVVDFTAYNDVRNHYVSLVPQNTRVKVLQHYKSVSYKREYFSEDLFTDFVGKTTSDDILISAYMGYKDIHKVVVTYSGDEHCDDLADWHIKVGRSFPIISPTAHNPSQGCSDPAAGERFHRPDEFEINGYLSK